MTSTIPPRVDYQKVMKRAQDFFSHASIRATIPVDLETAAQKLGISIVRKSLTGEISGFLFLDRSNEPIIGINSKHSTARQRFTLAHELGHLLLHAPKSGSASFIDKNFFIVNRNEISSKGVVLEEIEANFFAAEILMPADILYSDFVHALASSHTPEIHKVLAQKYEVSEEAMKFRLDNLGFIRVRQRGGGK